MMTGTRPGGGAGPGSLGWTLVGAAAGIALAALVDLHLAVALPLALVLAVAGGLAIRATRRPATQPGRELPSTGQEPAAATDPSRTEAHAPVTDAVDDPPATDDAAVGEDVEAAPASVVDDEVATPEVTEDPGDPGDAAGPTTVSEMALDGGDPALDDRDAALDDRGAALGDGDDAIAPGGSDDAIAPGGGDEAILAADDGTVPEDAGVAAVADDEVAVPDGPGAEVVAQDAATAGADASAAPLDGVGDGAGDDAGTAALADDDAAAASGAGAAVLADDDAAAASDAGGAALSDDDAAAASGTAAGVLADDDGAVADDDAAPVVLGDEEVAEAEEVGEQEADWWAEAQREAAAWPLRRSPARLDALALSELGVRPALAAAGSTYVRREIDAALDDALQPDALARSGGVVVVRGGPVSGRSRTLAEALVRHAGYRSVLVVAPPAPDAEDPSGWPLPALAARAADLLVAGEPAPIVWVDDAEQHLGQGLTLTVLDQIVSALPGCIVALVVDRGRLVLPELVPDPVERWLRAASDRHELSPALTDTELARAAGYLPGVPQARLRWLPAWASGVDQLRDRYRDGRSGWPQGAGLVRDVASWVRAGLPPVVSEDTLTVLGGGALDTSSLAWATYELAPGLAMLRRVGTFGADAAVPAYRLDPAVAAEVAAAGPLQADEVHRLLEHVAPVAALKVGRSAAAAGLEDAALAAFAQAAGSRDPEIRVLATLHLGVLHERAGQHDAAARSYGEPEVLHHPAYRALAAFHLGGVLEELDRPDDAIAAYGHAIEADDPDLSPLATFNLGWLHEQRTQLDEAERAYDRAVASGHPEASPMAAFNLGWVLERQRRMREAEHCYRTALDSGHADTAPMAAVSLGVLLQRLQRVKEARKLFEWAAASGHPEASVAARVRLGRRVRR